MGQNTPADTPADRVRELLATFSRSEVNVVHALCDCHDPRSVAYQVVSADLSSEVLTYGELRDRSSRFGAALHALGVRPGDRVATLMGKSADYLVALIGIWRLGAVHVPLFTAFAAAAVATRLVSSKAKVVVVDPDQRPKVAPPPDVSSAPAWLIVTTGDPDADALAFGELLAAGSVPAPAPSLGGEAPIIHIFTSGTTGNPKAVVVPAKALASFQAYAEFGLNLRSDDLYWCGADPGRRRRGGRG